MEQGSVFQVLTERAVALLLPREPEKGRKALPRLQARPGQGDIQRRSNLFPGQNDGFEKHFGECLS